MLFSVASERSRTAASIVVARDVFSPSYCLENLGRRFNGNVPHVIVPVSSHL